MAVTLNKGSKTEFGSLHQPKGQHLVVLQAVCTADMSFTDCYVGQVGSVHDATVRLVRAHVS